MKTPAPRTGSRAGGSTVANMTSGTHFFPQRRQLMTTIEIKVRQCHAMKTTFHNHTYGTSFILLNGASRWWYGTWQYEHGFAARALINLFVPTKISSLPLSLLLVVPTIVVDIPLRLPTLSLRQWSKLWYRRSTRCTCFCCLLLVLIALCERGGDCRRSSSIAEMFLSRIFTLYPAHVNLDHLHLLQQHLRLRLLLL